MKAPILIAALCLVALSLSMSPAMNPDDYRALMQELATMQEGGKLTEADAKVRELLDKHAAGLTDQQQEELLRELERSVRIRMDYSMSEDDLRAALPKRIRDFQSAEVDQWEREGRFDMKVIDGEKRYVGSTVANLFFRYPDIRARRLRPASDKWDNFLLAHSREVLTELQSPAEATAKPHRFRITMNITVKPGAVPKGDIIRCWMPYPLEFEYQGGVELESSSPKVNWINAPTYPVRSLYFEQPSLGDSPTTFTATYTLTTHARRFDIDPKLVAKADQTDNPYYEYYTAEDPPHVVFSDRIRKLAAEITGGETNPAIKAKLIFDWMCRNNKYSYAREYSTLRNIPEYVLDNGYGDCGQIGLTYIALCRASGIPARWQSGWIIYPIKTNLHDWTEIHLAPYGWVPVDPNYGMDIHNYFTTMAEDDREALRNFYFGGLDAYRLTVNREHSYPHYPAKPSFRSDDVDFQRGELEANGQNLYFNKFSYKLDVEFLNPEDDAAAKADTATPTPAPLLAPGIVR